MIKQANLRSLEEVSNHLDTFSLNSSKETGSIIDKVVEDDVVTTNNSPTSSSKFYLILHDISKKNNWGTILRSASAFGCSGIIAQARKRSDLQTFGAHGSDKRLKFFFCDEEDVFNYAKVLLNCTIIGIEIRFDAFSILSREFISVVQTKPCAFVLGNEGTGLHPSVAQKCDKFVYIPHYGSGTASLNVAVAGSIIFQRFAEIAKFPETQRVGEKFVVSEFTKEEKMKMNKQEGEEKRKLRTDRKTNVVLEGFITQNDGEEEEEE